MSATSISPPPVPVGEDWLSVEEVTRIFGYSGPNTLYTQRTRGRPPASLAIRWNGRLWFRASDINRLLNERLVDDPDQRWSKRHSRRGEQITTRARSELLAKKRAERKAREEAANDAS